jgi:hypothetical protein
MADRYLPKLLVVGAVTGVALCGRPQCSPTSIVDAILRSGEVYDDRPVAARARKGSARKSFAARRKGVEGGQKFRSPVFTRRRYERMS